MGEVGEFLEGKLGGGGETAAKAEILSWGNKFAGQRGLFCGLGGGGVGPIVADHGGERADRLAVEGFKEAGEEVGAEAGRHEGDNSRTFGHEARMDDLR